MPLPSMLKSYTIKTDNSVSTVRSVNGPIEAYTGLTSANPRFINWETKGKITTITGKIVMPNGHTIPINEPHTVTELDFLAP